MQKCVTEYEVLPLPSIRLRKYCHDATHDSWLLLVSLPLLPLLPLCLSTSLPLCLSCLSLLLPQPTNYCTATAIKKKTVLTGNRTKQRLQECNICPLRPN